MLALSKQALHKNAGALQQKRYAYAPAAAATSLLPLPLPLLLLLPHCCRCRCRCCFRCCCCCCRCCCCCCRCCCCRCRCRCCCCRCCCCCRRLSPPVCQGGHEHDARWRGRVPSVARRRWLLCLPSWRRPSASSSPLEAPAARPQFRKCFLMHCYITCCNQVMLTFDGVLLVKAVCNVLRPAQQTHHSWVCSIRFPDRGPHIIRLCGAEAGVQFRPVTRKNLFSHGSQRHPQVNRVGHHHPASPRSQVLTVFSNSLLNDMLLSLVPHQLLEAELEPLSKNRLTMTAVTYAAVFASE